MFDAIVGSTFGNSSYSEVIVYMVVALEIYRKPGHLNSTSLSITSSDLTYLLEAPSAPSTKLILILPNRSL